MPIVERKEKRDESKLKGTHHFLVRLNGFNVFGGNVHNTTDTVALT
jgi:hypothetical protein